MTPQTIYIPKNSMEDAVPMVRTAAFDRPADVPAVVTTEEPIGAWSVGVVDEKRAAEEAAQKQADAEFARTVEAEFVERTAKDKQACEATLRAKWGEAYDDRIDKIDKMLETTGKAAIVRTARMQDGSMLMSNTQAMEMMWRATQIHIFRGENRAEYNRSDRMQAEDRALIGKIDSMIAA